MIAGDDGAMVSECWRLYDGSDVTNRSTIWNSLEYSDVEE